MLKKSLLIALLACSHLVLASEALDLSGYWRCSGYDEHEGAYSDATLQLTLDKKRSDFKHGFGAYHFKLTEPENITYLGEAAANGNMVAIYFENTGADKDAQTDRGVGIATITHDMDKDKHMITELHKFYYEPTYQDGGNGYETCVKLEENKLDKSHHVKPQAPAEQSSAPAAAAPVPVVTVNVAAPEF